MKDNNPFSLTGSISYQEGSVVSRELFRNENATMTLFAFGSGQGLSEHKTPYEAFVILLDGEAEITVAGVKHLVKTGEILHMPSQKLHALKATKQFKMLLLMINKPATS